MIIIFGICNCTNYISDEVALEHSNGEVVEQRVGFNRITLSLPIEVELGFDNLIFSFSI